MESVRGAPTNVSPVYHQHLLVKTSMDPISNDATRRRQGNWGLKYPLLGKKNVFYTAESLYTYTEKNPYDDYHHTVWSFE